MMSRKSLTRTAMAAGLVSFTAGGGMSALAQEETLALE